MGRGSGAGLIRARDTQTLVAGQDTGPIFLSAAGFAKFQFAAYASGIVTGPSIQLWGTLDPATAGKLGQPGSATSTVGNGLARWFLLEGDNTAGGGATANPITVLGTLGAGNAAGQVFDYGKGVLAFRYVANAFTGGGSVIIDAFALL